MTDQELWNEVRKAWESSNKTYRELGEEYGLNPNTIKSRRSREKWQRPNATDATATQGVATRAQPKTNRKPIAPELEEEYQATIGEMNPELTERQQHFCLYYVKYWNATKAYQKAYPGVTEYTANTAGSRLMANDKIRAEIDRIKAEKFGRVGLDANVILQKWIDIAFADVTDFMEFGTEEEEIVDEETGEVKTVVKNYVRFLNSREVDGTLITEVKQGRDGIGVRLQDKIKALEVLTKYMDLLGDNTKRQLEQEKLKVELMQAQREADKEEEANNRRTVILTNEDEMRRLMNERNSRGKESTD